MRMYQFDAETLFESDLTDVEVELLEIPIDELNVLDDLLHLLVSSP